MAFVLVIAGVVVVLLVVAFLMDRRSKRIRGRVPRMRERRMFELNAELNTKARLSENIGGRHQMKKMDGPAEPTDPAR